MVLYVFYGSFNINIRSKQCQFPIKKGINHDNIKLIKLHIGDTIMNLFTSEVTSGERFR